MEQLRSEPVVQQKYHTSDQSKQKREPYWYKLWRTFGTTTKEQKLLEQQVRYPYQLSTFKNHGPKRLSHQRLRVCTRDVEPHTHEELITKSACASLKSSALQCEMETFHARRNRAEDVNSKGEV